MFYTKIIAKYFKRQYSTKILTYVRNEDSINDRETDKITGEREWKKY